MLRSTALRTLIKLSNVDLVLKNFSAFTLHDNKKNGQHDFLVTTTSVKHDDNLNNVFDSNLEWELRSCQHLLVEFQIEMTKYNGSIKKKKPQAKKVDENLDQCFNNFKCAAIMILAFEIILERIEYGLYQSRYTHKNKTQLGRSGLVFTKNDLTKLKCIIDKTDVIELGARENVNAMWKIHNKTIITVLAVFLKDIAKGCKDAVFPDFWLTNHTVKCLTFEKNTRQPKNINFYFSCFSCRSSPFERKTKTGRKNCSTFCSSTGWIKSASISSRVSTFQKFLLLKVCQSSVF